ncbi:XdhC family protein [Phormidesmis priestleyi]
MTLDFYYQLAEWLGQESVVVATIVSVKGSVPREVGAKMIIGSQNRIFSTIGGGAGEAFVIEQAAIVLQTGERQVVEIDLTGAPQRKTQGVCGGKMQVWLERWSGEEAIVLVHQILHRLKAGQSATLVTPFDANQLPHLLLNKPTLDSFIETLQPPPTLLIIGAGHVGEQLAKVAHLIGFQIVVQDDRSEWANTNRYPHASKIYTEAIANVIDHFTDHTMLYVALVTRGYQQDLIALETLLNQKLDCKYIGMIGSEKRVRQVYQSLENAGISQSKLRSIYAPIGLDIGALTPEEIAVSIAAELILVRRGGTGRCLRLVVCQP